MDREANAKVQSLLQKLIDSGEEYGLQVAAYLDGELVIDTWAGVADRRTGRPVDGDTLFTCFSTSKGIVYGCIHLLAERGQLSYDDPVAKYWPEFAARGKERVTIGHVLADQAGVPQVPAGATPQDYCNWNYMCSAIADQPLLWEPGKGVGYHGLTMGWILGEVVRRVDGRPFAQFVQEEICAPLRMRELYFGIPDEVEDRVAWLEAAPPVEGGAAPGPLASLAIPPHSEGMDGVFNRPDVRRACIPAAGGIVTARALARYYASLVSEVDGFRLLPASRVAIATEFQTDDLDQVLNARIRRARGFWLAGPCMEELGTAPASFGHDGAGGSVAYADYQHRFSIGFVKTRLVDKLDPTTTASCQVCGLIRQLLGVE